MSTKVRVAIITILILLIVVFMFGGFSGKVLAGPEVKVVKLGHMADFTNGLRNMSISMQKGVDLAVEQINAAGGIKSLGGAKLEVIHADHQFKAEFAKEASIRLIEADKVSALVLSLPSGFGVMIGKIANDAGVPYYPILVVTPEKTKQGFKTLFCPIADSNQLANYCLKGMNFVTENYLSRKPAKIGYLYADLEYPRTVLNAVGTYAAEMGYEIVARVSYPFPAMDLTSYILKVKAANPDVVFCNTGGGEATLMEKTMYDLGYDPLRLGMFTSYMDIEFIQTLKERAENAIASCFFFEGLNDHSRAFGVAFSAKYGNAPDTNSAVAYQTIRVIAAAIEKAGSADRAAIIKSSQKIKYTRDTGPLILPYRSIQFDETGQIPLSESGIVFSQVQNGKFVSIWPKQAGITMRFKDSWKNWKK